MNGPRLRVRRTLVQLSLLKHSLVAALIVISVPAMALADSFCVFLENGVIKQVKDIESVPEGLRDSARCFKATPKDNLAKPDEVDLDNKQRKASIVTALGKAEVRWPRSAESKFKKLPDRLFAAAAKVVARFLKTQPFPPSIRNLRKDWNVVILDEDLPPDQIPTYLQTNCHPGWMTPPGNIYIVAGRLRGCAPKSGLEEVAADTELTKVLVHELGHGVEAMILEDGFAGDRTRAEGFATWFENSTLGLKLSLPANSFVRQNGSNFHGGYEDYYSAALYIKALVDLKGVRGLLSVYEYIKANGAGFFQATDAVLRVREEDLYRLIQKELH